MTDLLKSAKEYAVDYTVAIKKMAAESARKEQETPRDEEQRDAMVRAYLEIKKQGTETLKMVDTSLSKTFDEISQIGFVVKSEFEKYENYMTYNFIRATTATPHLKLIIRCKTYESQAGDSVNAYTVEASNRDYTRFELAESVINDALIEMFGSAVQGDIHLINLLTGDNAPSIPAVSLPEFAGNEGKRARFRPFE